MAAIRWTRVCAILLVLTAPRFALAEPDVFADVVYGHKDGMALFYDVIRPAQPSGAGVIYMVSGGWFSVWQPPEQRFGYFDPLLAEGFTVFAVHHGSAPRFKVPEAVSDVRAAVRHIHEHAAQYGIDPKRLGVFGGSAGGHLSLMLGLDSQSQPDAAASAAPRRSLGPYYASNGDSDARVAAVVAYYPPVDLRGLAGPNERFPALEFDPDQAAAISPLLFVSSDDPPTLLVHGDADTLVPVSNSQRLDEALTAQGVEHELVVIEGGDHGFRDPALRARADAAMVRWFKQHL
ncbi:MAG: alpha/beta hydrolase [Pseudomonadales bacterium]